MFRPGVVVLLIFFFLNGLLCTIGQPLKPDEIKKICTQFPDEKCVAVNETFAYSFSIKKTGKTSAFLVKEDYSGTFVTPEKYYSKVNSVFYDDYSDISSVKYKINQLPYSNFPVIYTNYESEGIFHDDIKVCAYKMDMRKDKTYEVNYSKTFRNPRLFSRIFFHNNYPVHKETVSFEIPDWVEIELKPVNFEGFAISRKEVPLAQKKARQVIYEITDLKAIPNESHSPSTAKFLPHLLVFIKANNDPVTAEKFFSTPGELYKWCKLLVDSVNNETDSLKEVLREIKTNETDSFKIMEKIFYWVQDHVRYIAFENGIMGYKPMAAKKVCTMLYGDCKGMANLMKNLLKLAGFDARLTWIGTNDIPYTNELPTLALYNHMICTAFLGGKKYFLDATEQYIAINDYAERIQGRPVMIENGNSYLKDKVPSYNHERNNQDEQCEVWIEGSLLKGKSTLTLNGETKTNYMRKITSLKSENQDLATKNFLRSGNTNLKIKSFSSSNLAERSMPMVIHYDYDLQNAVFYSSTKEILILPEKDRDFCHLDFDSTRQNDYEFNYRYFTSFTTKINIPKDYSVKSTPAQVSIKADTYEIQLRYENKGTFLLLIKNIIIKNILLKKSGFKEWNANVKKLNDFYSAPVILKKN